MGKYFNDIIEKMVKMSDNEDVLANAVNVNDDENFERIMTEIVKNEGKTK